MIKVFEILKNIETNIKAPIIRNFIVAIKKDPELKSNKTFELVKNLAFYLYILNEKDYALEATTLISDKTFNGDYDLWTWVEFVLVLQSRILREKKDLSSSMAVLEKINNVLDAGDEIKRKIRRKALNRRLNGALLYSDQIKNAHLNNDKKEEVTWRFLHFCQLCYMRELGGSDTYPTSKLENEIQEHLLILSRNISLLE